MSEKPHNCTDRINALLAGKNTRLAVAIAAITPGSPERELIQVTTVKADDRQRGKPAVLFATHCPFCGIKLKGMS